jgi:hypothetical protein
VRAPWVATIEEANEIAFQANLLALDAAVEAAHRTEALIRDSVRHADEGAATRPGGARAPSGARGRRAREPAGLPGERAAIGRGRIG